MRFLGGEKYHNNINVDVSVQRLANTENETELEHMLTLAV